MFIFWLSAAATSRYNCDDLCNACPNFSALSFDDLSCACGGAYDWYWKRGMSPKPSGLLQKRRTYTRRAGTYGAKRGLMLLWCTYPSPLMAMLIVTRLCDTTSMTTSS